MLGLRTKSLFATAICLVGFNAHAQTVSEFFYLNDDDTIAHRLSTKTSVFPGHSIPPTVGPNEELIVAMADILFCIDPNEPCTPKQGSNYSKVKDNVDDEIWDALMYLQNAGRLHQVKAWQIIDEPYIRGITRADIEHAGDRLKWISQSAPFLMDGTLPQWTNFAQECFACNPNRVCNQPYDPLDPGRFCAVPGNANWISFDWYAGSENIPSNPTHNGFKEYSIEDHVDNRVIPAITKLKATRWGPYQQIVLVPGTFSGAIVNSFNAITSIGANEILSRYTDLALSDPDIIGVIAFNYLDADPDINGNIAHKGIEGLDASNDGQGEMFYQAIASESVAGFVDPTWKPVYEYNDDTSFSKTGAISEADSHYYTIGRNGTEIGVYAIRRLAFYMRTAPTAEYTSKLYRCTVQQVNARSTVFFTPNANCNNSLYAVQDGHGYVSPTPTAEASHAILKCGNSMAPYWNQTWTLVETGQNHDQVCQDLYGPTYSSAGVFGYSKKF